MARFEEAFDCALVNENLSRLFEKSINGIFTAQGDSDRIMESCPIFQVIEKVLVEANKRWSTW